MVTERNSDKVFWRHGLERVVVCFLSVEYRGRGRYRMGQRSRNVYDRRDMFCAFCVRSGVDREYLWCVVSCELSPCFRHVRIHSGSQTPSRIIPRQKTCEQLTISPYRLGTSKQMPHGVSSAFPVAADEGGLDEDVSFCFPVSCKNQQSLPRRHLHGQTVLRKRTVPGGRTQVATRNT